MSRASKLALMLLAAHQAYFLPRALACSRAYVLVKVKTAFVVFVHDPTGSPLANMEIRAYEAIRKSGDEPAHVELAGTAVTGKDGKAAIGLVQDDYTLSASVNGVSSEIVQISVYNDGSGVSELNLRWPGGPITAVQHVSGILEPGLEVSLKSDSSDIGKTVTDASGHFAFHGVSPGFYALHVSDRHPSVGHSSKLEGNILILVTPDSADRELPRWRLVMSSCGLSAYKEDNSLIFFGP